jgi:hypothetical protein
MAGLATIMLLGQALAGAPTISAYAPQSERAETLQATAADELAGFEKVSDDELDTHRGGFTWEGVEISLGAEIRTYLNGQLVLQTNVSWTSEGAQTIQTVSGLLTPVDAAQLQAGIFSAGGITMNVGGQSVFLANGGQTALLHRVDGGIQNVLINRASGITARQEVDAVIDLQNFDQFQQDLILSRIGATLGEIVGQITSAGIGN